MKLHVLCSSFKGLLHGIILGWSLVHGGPGGNFMSKTLFDCFAYGIDKTDADIEDIPDRDLRDELNKVNNVQAQVTGLFT